MKVTTVKASYRRTFNLGNFNSLSLECQLEAFLDEGENEIEASNILHTQCREVIRLQYQNAIENKQEDLVSINQPVAPF